MANFDISRRTGIIETAVGSAPDNPVALVDWSNHQLRVNRKARSTAAGVARRPARAHLRDC